MRYTTKITDTTEEAEKRGAVVGEARRLAYALVQRGRDTQRRHARDRLGLGPGIHEAIEKKTWMAVTGHGHDVGGDEGRWLCGYGSINMKGVLRGPSPMGEGFEP